MLNFVMKENFSVNFIRSEPNPALQLYTETGFFRGSNTEGKKVFTERKKSDL